MAKIEPNIGAPGTGSTRGFGVTANRKKWDPDDILNQPVSWVDSWLAENPASEEERKMAEPLAKVASSSVDYSRGFEKEWDEIGKALADCGGDFNEFERRYQNHDFFADSPEVSVKDQFSTYVRAAVRPPRGDGHFVAEKVTHMDPNAPFPKRKSAALDDGTD